MPQFANHLTDIADVLLSTATDGEVRVNLGNLFDGAGLGAEVGVWGVDGFVSRPNDPDAAGACQAIYLVDGQDKRVIATRDNRWAAKVGTLQPGDRGIVTNSAARVLVKRAQDSVTLFTENATDDGSSMMVNLDGSTGKLLAAVGGAYLEMDKDAITLSAGGSMLRIDAAGVFTFGPHTGLCTAGGNLGVVGKVPPPVGVGSILAGATGPIGVGSTKWTVAGV